MIDAREQALNMGAHEPPIGPRAELIADLIDTLKTDIEFYRGTDNPMYGLVVARTLKDIHELGLRMEAVGIRSVIVTAGARNLQGALRALSGHEVDCILMPEQLATAGGFRLPVKRVTIACIDPLPPERAIQLLGRAHMEATVRSLVWLRPEIKYEAPVEAAPPAKLYPHLLVTFNEKLTPIQQDAIVQTLLLMNAVSKIDLGTLDDHCEFVASETATKEDAEKIHRALHQPDED